MSESSVSVVIPVFNGEAFLDEALQSIFGQTRRAEEVIIVDDGSTDATREVAARHGERIRYVHQKNQGPGAARNTGIRHARGAFIAFLDADDLWLPNKLERQIAHLAARPELVLSFAAAANFWTEELRAEREQLAARRLAPPQPAFVLPTMLAQRSVFDTIGLFDTRFRVRDDRDWLIKVVERGVPFEILPDVLLRRRLHRDNITRRMSAVASEELAHILKESLDRRRRSGELPSCS